MIEGRLYGISVRVVGYGARSAPKGLKIWKEGKKKVQVLLWTLKGTAEHLAYLFFVLQCV